MLKIEKPLRLGERNYTDQVFISEIYRYGHYTRYGHYKMPLICVLNEP